MKILFLLAVLVIKVNAQTCAGITAGWDWQNGSHFNGFKWFPNSKMWNSIAAKPVHANSATWMSQWRADGGDPNALNFTNLYLFPGSYMLGSTNFSNNNYNTEIMVVTKDQPKVTVYCGGLSTDCYEHDPSDIPLPIPRNPRVQHKCNAPGEGCPKYNTDGDKHVMVLDKDSCIFYELFNTFIGPQGKLYATSVSIWDAAGGDAQRPLGWTSGSQAGLPWWMGAIRAEEIASGSIQHAIAMTGFKTSGNPKYFDSSWASHANGFDSGKTIPYGARARLKSSFDVSSFSPQVQTVLNAMKTYGVYVLDGGSQEVPVEQSENYASYLTNYGLFLTCDFGCFFKTANFDIVDDFGPILDYLNPGGWPTGSAPSVTSFIVTPSVINLGQEVTFSWTTTGAANDIVAISRVGAIRGAAAGSVKFKPPKSGTLPYKLYVTNKFGQTTSSPISVTVNP